MRKGDPYPQITLFSLQVVASGRKCTSRSSTTPTDPCSTNLLGGTYLVPPRKQVAHKLSGPKGSPFGLNRVPRPLLKQDSIHSNRQHHGGCLYKQGSRHKVGLTISPIVENPVLVLLERDISQA